MNLQEIGEFALIEKIKDMVDVPSEAVIAGIEDDAAAIELSNDQILLLTTDALIEGVHFDLSYFSFFQLGWRAMAVNLSDIAAMGGRPQYALVVVGLPAHLPTDAITDLYAGIKALADRYQTKIVGGDTTQSPERIYLSLTVTGQVEKNNLTLRSGAQIGDGIYVTGKLGGALAGLKLLKTGDSDLQARFSRAIARHLIPHPRVSEARYLVENLSIHAMIDVSDGLASEINHICRLSHVGAIVYEKQIPIEPEIRSTAEFFHDRAVDYALYGGEDFELLFTAPEETDRQLREKFRTELCTDCTKIGQITERAEEVILENAVGAQTSLDGKGYDHFSETKLG